MWFFSSVEVVEQWFRRPVSSITDVAINSVSSLKQYFGPEKQFFPTNVPAHSAAELHAISTEASKQALIAALALAATLSHPPQTSNLYYYPITTSAISSHDNPAQTSSPTFSTQTASYYIAKNDCSH